MTDFAAVDLGAESGRVVRGRFDGSRVTLDVAHRFANAPVRLPDGLRWNLLGLPFHYRDARTEGMVERAFARVPREELYEETGIQTMRINTVFQLLADDDARALAGAVRDMGARIADACADVSVTRARRCGTPRRRARRRA